MPRPWSTVLLFVALVPLLLYVAAVALLWWKQEALLFYPQPLAADTRLAVDPDVAEHRVEVAGASLSVLQLKRPGARGVVFFLHGNGGNLASWFTNAGFYRDANFDLVMPDYRGYGKSSDRIGSAQQLHQDVRAVWDRFAPEYAGRRIVVYGRSLGTALAADLAAQLSAEGRPPDLTVLVSAYASMAAMREEYYPWVPPFVLRYPLDTGSALPRVRGPVLLVHGTQDTLIRPVHAQRLQQLAPQARLLLVPGAAHDDVHEFRAYRDAFAAALAAL